MLDVETRRTAPPRQEAHFRPDIEGLRAVAVLLVVAYHAGIGAARGGFVGVDVFFVISGYLITSVLLRELDVTSGISLPRFYARRMRRLLPASLVMLMSVAVLGAAVLSPLQRVDLGGDLAAAATFVANWRFASQAVDYLAQQRDASPLLHMWSLSVEEQFYLVWPIVIGALVFVARRTARAMRTSLGFGVAALLVGSAAWSMFETQRSAGSAYFSSFVRAWEPALGGLLAVAAPQLRALPPAFARRVGWLGLGAIVTSAAVLDRTVAFPGLVAFWPTLGAAAVIVAGLPRSDGGVARVLSAAPLVAIGRVSYAWYLWHWPLLVLAADRWGPPGTVWRSAAVCALAFAVARVSLAVVEDPVRHSARLRAATSTSLVAGALCIAVVTAVGWVTQHPSEFSPTPVVVAAPPPAADERTSDTIPNRAPNPASSPASPVGGATSVRTAQTTTTGIVPPTASTGAATALPTSSVAAVPPNRTPVPNPARRVASAGNARPGPPSTATAFPAPFATTRAAFAAASNSNSNSNSTSSTPMSTTSPPTTTISTSTTVPGLQLSATSLSPSPLNARRDLPALYTNGCHRNFEDTDTAGCVFGDRASGTSVVLFGDSHAASWFPALERLAKSNGWRLIALTKSGCPAKDIEPYNPNHKRAYEECTTWRGKVFERIAKERPAAVITASINAYAVSVGGSTLSPSDGADAETEGWVRTVDVLLQSTPSVILVRDTPEMGRDEASCVSEHRRDLAQCSAARSGALAPNLSDVRAAFALASRPGFRYVDLSDSICLPTVCPAVADDILLYRDANHLTATFSRSLADALESQLPPLG